MRRRSQKPKIDTNMRSVICQFTARTKSSGQFYLTDPDAALFSGRHRNIQRNIYQVRFWSSDDYFRPHTRLCRDGPHGTIPRSNSMAAWHPKPHWREGQWPSRTNVTPSRNMRFPTNGRSSTLNLQHRVTLHLKVFSMGWPLPMTLQE